METSADVVKECAALREQNTAPRPMTIAEAISDARWLERTPDGFMDPRRARQIIATLHAALQSSPCFYKAIQNGEEVFVLRQIDRAAPAAIVAWADAAHEHGCRDEKVDEAYRMSGRWTNQPTEKTKWPD